MWTHRLLLEGLDHAEKSFITLTYSEDRRDLDPIDFQKWLKRIRKYTAPKKLRFFGVGEYGDISLRPHYHVALFGYPHCQGGAKIDGACQCHACLGVRETWNYGHVMVGRLEKQSAQYIAGYVTKKMTHSSDTRLGGRHPEFARMSLRPGIGANAMYNVASEMMRYKLEDRGDVPIALRFGGSMMPLGRYLRGQLRMMVGHEKKTPPEGLQEAADRLSLVRAFAWQEGRSVSSVIEEINEPYSRLLGAKMLKRREL